MGGMTANESDDRRRVVFLEVFLVKIQDNFKFSVIPPALFPHYWRGFPKNCFVHSYPLTGRRGAMGGCQGGEMHFSPLTASEDLSKRRVKKRKQGPMYFSAGIAVKFLHFETNCYVRSHQRQLLPSRTEPMAHRRIAWFVLYHVRCRQLVARSFFRPLCFLPGIRHHLFYVVWLVWYCYS